jgi:serine phosphatase RsbU (regulator of sigma subunit)/anti-sigma regulatory factor (Ser/Thr protein kinase)/anti-anti-sigma regulatory factor
VDPESAHPPDAELATVRAVLDALPGFMVAVEGPDMRLVAVSATVRALARRAEWLGRPLAEVYPELAVQGVLGIYDEVYRTGEPFHAPEWRLELTDQPGGVAEVVVSWTSVPWRRPDGSVRGVIGVAGDVTELVAARRRAEQQAAESGDRYRRVHDVVRELQQVLLPAGVPVLPRVDIAARYLVAGEEQSAGGDWFDVRPLADGRVGLVVGDVVGHGVSAAAAMSQLRAVLAHAVDRTGDAAAAVAELEDFAGSLPGARAATVVVAVLDLGAGSVEYVTRGHPPPLLVDAAGNGRYLLSTGGGPLGGPQGGPAQRTRLADGDVLLLFSDGLVERPDRPYAAGLDELTRVAEAAAVGPLWPSGGPASVVERICADAVELLTRRGFDDDVTVVAVAPRPPVPPLRTRVHAREEELPRLRAELRDWLDALRLSLADQLAVELAVGEAVDNAVEHGFGHLPTGVVIVSLELHEDGCLRVRIDDDGMWRRPAVVGGRGRGLRLIGSLADELAVDGQPTGTTVTFSRRLSRPVVTTSAAAVTSARAVDTAQPFDTLAVGTPPLLRVRGPVDALSAQRFRAELTASTCGGAGPLTVDLTAVSQLTSVGVAALVDVLRAGDAAGQEVVLVAPTGTAAAFVLDLVGLPRQAAP